MGVVARRPSLARGAVDPAPLEVDAARGQRGGGRVEEYSGVVAAAAVQQEV